MKQATDYCTGWCGKIKTNGSKDDPVTGDNSTQANKTPIGKSTQTTTTTHNETSGQEPISGSQGAGTMTEPFDKGNSGKQVSSS